MIPVRDAECPKCGFTYKSDGSIPIMSNSERILGKSGTVGNSALGPCCLSVYLSTFVLELLATRQYMSDISLTKAQQGLENIAAYCTEFKSSSVKTEQTSQYANKLSLTSTRFCLFCALWTHKKLHEGRFTGST